MVDRMLALSPSFAHSPKEYREGGVQSQLKRFTIAYTRRSRQRSGVVLPSKSFIAGPGGLAIKVLLTATPLRRVFSLPCPRIVYSSRSGACG